MERKTLRRSPFINLIVNPINKLLNICDLFLQIKSLGYEFEIGNKNLDSKVLLSQSDKKIVLTTVNTGTEIEFFQSMKSITVKIISGKVKVRSRNELLTLGKGQLLRLFENKCYQMTAIENTIFLLTTVDVVQQHSLMNIPLN